MKRERLKQIPLFLSPALERDVAVLPVDVGARAEALAIARHTQRAAVLQRAFGDVEQYHAERAAA